MKDDAAMLFAEVTSLLEDLHGIGIEGKQPDSSSDMRQLLCASLCDGVKSLGRLMAEIDRLLK